MGVLKRRERRDRINPQLINDREFVERVAKKAEAAGIALPWGLMLSVLLKALLALAKRRFDEPANVVRALNQPSSVNESKAWVSLREDIRVGMPTASVDQIEQLLDIAKQEARDQAARRRRGG